MSGRLYCTPKAMWKLNWFLRHFGYVAELLGKNEIDDKAPDRSLGRAQSQRSHHTRLNFDGFAPASRWEDLSVSEQQRF